jgi:hypothetical protein
MNPDDELIAALEKARALYGDGHDARAYVIALGAVSQYFLRLGMPLDLMMPLEKLRNILFDKATHAGKRKRPSEESHAFADAAAVVTVLHERGWRIPDATKKVSAATGLDKKKLESFRNNLNRGLHDDFTRFIYAQMLALRQSQKLKDEELLNVLLAPWRQRKR